jgi:hypothetical protein
MTDQLAEGRWQAIALATEYARRYEPRYYTGLFVPDEWIIRLLVDLMGEKKFAGTCRRQLEATAQGLEEDLARGSTDSEGNDDEKNGSERGGAILAAQHAHAAGAG